MKYRLSLKDGYLVVSAEKGLDEDEKDKKSWQVLKKRALCRLMPEKLSMLVRISTEEDIKAQFQHGMLTVTVAKKEAKPAVEEKKHIAIEG